MMFGNRLNHFWILVPLLGQVSTYQSMWTLRLVIYGLADIMQQTGLPGSTGISSKLAGQHARQMRDFETVQQNVLTVAGAKLELAD
jgi:hypothetical protein